MRTRSRIATLEEIRRLERVSNLAILRAVTPPKLPGLPPIRNVAEERAAFIAALEREDRQP